MSNKKIIKDCLLGMIKNEQVCKESDCSTCGWNPRVAAKREETKKFHTHKNGLKGF